MLVAGGGLAYFRTSQRRPHRESSVAQNGNGTSEADENKGKDLIAKKKPKRGGIKNVKVLAGLLLQHIGKGGLNEFIALATISVSFNILLLFHSYTLSWSSNTILCILCRSSKRH